MQCATVGELRAFLDGELRDTERILVETHLDLCVSCQIELGALKANALVVESALGPLGNAALPAPRVAWSRVRERAEGRGGSPVTLDRRVSDMFRGLLHLAGGSKLRMASSAVAVLVAVALLFTLSPVQTAASSFLSLFRVKKFVAVTVDPSSLPNLGSPSDLGQFTVTGDQKPRQVSLAEAEKMAGFKVLTPASLPSGLEPNPKATTVTGPVSVTFTPDLKKVREYLSGIGASNVSLPDNLDGAPISLQTQPAVAILYTEEGGVERTPDGLAKPHVGQKFLYVGETTSPTMNVPDGVDVERIRAELLQVPGLPPDLVNQLKSIEDWRNTVVVPVVKGTSREVTVQGEQGLLVSETGGQGRTLLWLKGSVVFTLTGNLSEDEMIAVADSMK